VYILTTVLPKHDSFNLSERIADSNVSTRLAIHEPIILNEGWVLPLPIVLVHRDKIIRLLRVSL